jgi:hypothetical protein
MGAFKDRAIDERNAALDERLDEKLDERKRRGKSSRRRGNQFERDVARDLGVARVGQFGGKADIAGDWIVAQCKVGGSYSERYDGWLRSVPVKGDQLRALVVGDTPALGHARRRIIVLDFDDFVAWFGKSGAQGGER